MKKSYEFLEKIGLNETDTALYLKLLEIGKCSITELSRKAKVPRSTSYESIDRLQKKGLVSNVIVGNRKKLIAEDPNKVKLIIYNNKIKKESEINELESLEKDIPQFLENINQLVANNGNFSVQVKYYEGEKGFQQVCQRSLKSAEEEICFISNMDEWKKIFTDEFAYTYYVPERLKLDIFARTLAMKGELASDIRSNDERYKREMRYLPDSYDFKPTIIITKSEVSIMTSSRPYNAILIQSELIAKLYQDIFNDLWGRAQ